MARNGRLLQRHIRSARWDAIQCSGHSDNHINPNICVREILATKRWYWGLARALKALGPCVRHSQPFSVRLSIQASMDAAVDRVVRPGQDALQIWLDLMSLLDLHSPSLANSVYL